MQRAHVTTAPKTDLVSAAKAADVKVVVNVKPVIHFSDIKAVVDSYPQVSLASQPQWLHAAIAKKFASSSSTMTRELLATLPKQAADYKQALNADQLFDTAVILAKTKDSTDLKAASRLRDILGAERISVAKMLAEKIKEQKITREKAALLFDTLCQVPEAHVKHVAMLFIFEGNFYHLSEATLKQVVKHSGRLEGLYELGKEKYKLYESANENVFRLPSVVFDASSAWTAAALFVQFYIIKQDKAHIDAIVNQLMCTILETGNHIEAIAFATLWLANHGIDNEANLKVVREHPEALGYLPQVGNIISDAKTMDLKFHQELFDLAMKKGLAYPGVMFPGLVVDEKRLPADTSKKAASGVALSSPPSPR